jgi:hypothetical protein
VQRLGRGDLVVVAVGVGDGLGEVLGQVADRLADLVLSRGDDALIVDLGPELHHVRRGRGRVVPDRVQGLVPGRQERAVDRVDESAGYLVPPGQVVADVHRLGALGPRQLGVGGGGDVLDGLARDDAPDSGMQVRREAALRFDGGEVLDLVPGAAAQVLPEPVDDLREVQRVHRGPVVIVRVRVGRCPVRTHFAVRGKCEGEEHARPVGLPVRAGEGRADGADLTDMIYLSCAAGYADYVVCERATAGTLREAVRRRGGGTQVFRRLQDAVPVISSSVHG